MLMDMFYNRGGNPNLALTRAIESKYSVKLAFIDAGMVTSLSELD
jgi:hypothetical protein